MTGAIKMCHCPGPLTHSLLLLEQLKCFSPPSSHAQSVIICADKMCVYTRPFTHSLLLVRIKCVNAPFRPLTVCYYSCV